MKYYMRKDRTFAERLYKLNKVAGANHAKIDLMDVVFRKIQDPPFENEDNEEGSV